MRTGPHAGAGAPHEASLQTVSDNTKQDSTSNVDPRRGQCLKLYLHRLSLHRHGTTQPASLLALFPKANGTVLTTCRRFQTLGPQSFTQTTHSNVLFSLYHRSLRLDLRPSSGMTQDGPAYCQDIRRWRGTPGLSRCFSFRLGLAKTFTDIDCCSVWTSIELHSLLLPALMMSVRTSSLRLLTTLQCHRELRLGGLSRSLDFVTWHKAV